LEILLGADIATIRHEATLVGEVSKEGEQLTNIGGFSECGFNDSHCVQQLHASCHGIVGMTALT
jgi:hypothetical protein